MCRCFVCRLPFSSLRGNNPNSILALQAHPYALLMREFYFQLPRRQRPHVFGMTASPVNVRATHTLQKVGATIVELETTLDAKVQCHDNYHFHDLFQRQRRRPSTFWRRCDATVVELGNPLDAKVSNHDK